MRLIFASILLLVSGQVSASIVEHRFFEDDPTGLVYIEDTGYEWLNFGFSYGKSYQQSVNQYDNFGFRAANIDDISNMFLSLGVDSVVQTECSHLIDQSKCTHNAGLYPDPEWVQPIHQWFETVENNSNILLLGMYDPVDDFFGLTDDEVIYLRAQYAEPSEQSVIQIVRGKFGINNFNSQYGTFLIRESCSEFPGGGATGGEFPGGGATGGCFPGKVPEPPAILLFGIGLIGLVGFSKRRKAA